MSKLGYIDGAVILVYAILCLFVAFKYIGKIRNIKDYSLGGSFHTKVLSATFFATFTGAGVLLGYIERIHEVGILFAAAFLFEPLAWLVTAKLFTQNIDYFKQRNCMTLSDIMQVLYGDFAKWTSNILSILLSIGTLAIQIKAVGYLLEYFFGIREDIGSFMGLGIVVAYSYFGGIRAVIFTDVLQSIVFLVGIPTACFTAYYSLGGYTEMLNILPQQHKTIEFSNENIMLLAGSLVYGLLPLGEMAFVQRFLIAKDANQLKNALYYTFMLAIPFALIVILTGFITYATAPEAASKLAFFGLIDNNLPVGVRGLVIAGILAAIMSTADSFLNSASVVFAHNVVKPLYPKISANTELRIAKLATLAFSILGFAMAFMGTSLAKLLWLSENFWAPFCVVPLVAGFLKFYTNGKSFIVAFFTALVFVFIGRHIAGEFGIISMVSGLIGNAIGLFGMHKFQGLPFIQKGLEKTATTSWFKEVTPRALYKTMQRDVQGKVQRYYYFATFGVLFFLFSSLAFTFSDTFVQQTVMWMRVAALLICALLSMNELLQSKMFQQRIMPIFWNLALIYCLPFLSIYTLLISDFDFAWLVNLVISLMLLSLLCSANVALVSMLLGLVSAIAVFKSFGAQTSAHLDINFTYMLIALYALGAALIVYLMKRREQEYAERITSKLLYSSIIAHEAKSPLATIQMAANHLKGVVESEPNLNENKEMVLEFLTQIENASKQSVKNIERTLSNLRSDIAEASDYGKHSIEQCVKEVMEEYGLSKSELKRIVVSYDGAFKFVGSKHFMKLILLNLISNFLRHAGKHSTLNIFMNARSLYLKDNGVGMDEEQRLKIFIPFDKGGSITGTGVGLAFCDHAMREMKGSIDVITGVGKGTTFVLKFPKLK